MRAFVVIAHDPGVRLYDRRAYRVPLCVARRAEAEALLDQTAGQGIERWQPARLVCPAPADRAVDLDRVANADPPFLTRCEPAVGKIRIGELTANLAWPDHRIAFTVTTAAAATGAIAKASGALSRTRAA
jgi:hypothetical protein